MGRSEKQPATCVFVEDIMRTQAFQPSKLSGPKYIYTHLFRVLGNDTIVTNGDQTDTVYDLMSQGPAAVIVVLIFSDAPHRCEALLSII